MTVTARWDADTAVEELYAAHYRRLVRLAILLVRDPETAEEVVQDSFVAMHGKWRTLKDPGSGLAYLRQTVVNRARSVLRHRGVHSRYVAAHRAAPAAEEPGADERALADERRDRVLDALRELPGAAAGGARAALLPRPVRGRDRRHPRHQPGRGEEPRLARCRRAPRAAA